MTFLKPAFEAYSVPINSKRTDIQTVKLRSPADASKIAKWTCTTTKQVLSYKSAVLTKKAACCYPPHEQNPR